MERPVLLHQEVDDVVLLLRQPPGQTDDEQIKSGKVHRVSWREWESGSSRNRLVKEAISAEICPKQGSAEFWNSKGENADCNCQPTRLVGQDNVMC